MLTIEKLEVNQEDAQVINEMRRADLKKQGYNGLVMCDPNRLYEIKGRDCRDITRMWIRLAQHSAKIGN